MEKISKHSVIISAMLIFFGALKLYFFYSEFDIPIFNYLTISEIVVSLFDNIIVFVWFVVWAFFQSIVGYWIMNISKKSIFENMKAGFDKVVNSEEKWLFSFYLISSFLIYIPMYFNFEFTFSHIYIFILSLFVSQAASFLIDVINLEIKDNKLSVTFDAFFTFASGFLVVTFCFTTKNVKELRKNLMETHIITQNERIVCSKDSKMLFLGKTENFVFLFNDSSKTSIIYPIGDVKRIEQTKISE